eukprot:3937514-Rhodomonas_salina.1
MDGISWKMEKLAACGWRAKSAQNTPDCDSRCPLSSIAPDIHRTAEEHLDHVRSVLDILLFKKLYAKGSKCDFFRTEVQFLGFRMGDRLIPKDPAKVEAVRNWPEPKTVLDAEAS